MYKHASVTETWQLWESNQHKINLLWEDKSFDMSGRNLHSHVVLQTNTVTTVTYNLTHKTHSSAIAAKMFYS